MARSRKPAEPSPEAESKPPTKLPIRVSPELVDIIRACAAAAKMTSPEWIESRLTPIALKEFEEIPSRLKQFKKPD